jgi:hypothetical protein
VLLGDFWQTLNKGLPSVAFVLHVVADTTCSQCRWSWI